MYTAENGSKHSHTRNLVRLGRCTGFILLPYYSIRGIKPGQLAMFNFIQPWQSYSSSETEHWLESYVF